MVPEQATFAVTIAAHALLKFCTGVRVAQTALLLEKQGELLVEQNPRKRLVVFAAFVPLGVWKLRQHHLSGRAVTLSCHFCGGVSQAFFHAAALALGIPFGLYLFRFARPVKPPVLAQMVNNAGPLLC